MTDWKLTDVKLNQSFSHGGAYYECWQLNTGEFRLILTNERNGTAREDVQAAGDLILSLLETYLKVMKERENDR